MTLDDLARAADAAIRAATHSNDPAVLAARNAAVTAYAEAWQARPREATELPLLGQWFEAEEEAE